MRTTKTEGSFSDQVAAMTGWLRRIALKYTKNHEAAKDLASDVQLKALLQADRFEPGSNLKAWLYTLTHNHFVTEYHRKKKRGETLGYDAINEGWAGLPVCHNEAESDMGVAVVEDALSKLRPRDQVIMRGRVLGYEYHELAEQTNLPIGTIKNRIFQNRKKLHTYMAHPSPDVLLKSAPKDIVFFTNNTVDAIDKSDALPAESADNSTPPMSRTHLVLTYLLNKLSTLEFRRLDFTKAAAHSGYSEASLRNYVIPALVEIKGLEKSKEGIVCTYRRPQTFFQVQALDLENAIKQRNIGPKQSAAILQPGPTPGSAPAALGTSQEEIDKAISDFGQAEKESQPTVTVTVSETVGVSNGKDGEPDPNQYLSDREAVGKVGSLPDKTQFGYCGAGGLLWFDSYDEAVISAKKYLTDELPQISIVRKVGLIKLEIVEIRY